MHASSTHSSSTSSPTSNSNILQQTSVTTPAQTKDVTVLVSTPHHERLGSPFNANVSSSQASVSQEHDLLDMLAGSSMAMQPLGTSTSGPQAALSSILDSAPCSSQGSARGGAAAVGQPGSSNTNTGAIDLRVGISHEQMHTLDQLLNPQQDEPSSPPDITQQRDWPPDPSEASGSAMQLLNRSPKYSAAGDGPVFLYTLASEPLDSGTGTSFASMGSQDLDAAGWSATHPQSGVEPGSASSSSSPLEGDSSTTVASPHETAGASSSSSTSNQAADLLDAAASAASLAMEVVGNVATEVTSIATEAVRALTPSPSQPLTDATQGDQSRSSEAAIRSQPGASSSAATSSSDEAERGLPSDGARKWALGVLAGTYMHQAATSFSIPLMVS